VPTVLRVGPYRCFFYASDEPEPPHVHVRRDDDVVKFWLQPVRVQGNTGFRRTELRSIQRLVEEHEVELLEAWNEYFQG